MVFPDWIVPEMPFEEAQVNTGAVGTEAQPAVTDADCRHMDSPAD